MMWGGDVVVAGVASRLSRSMFYALRGFVTPDAGYKPAWSKTKLDLLSLWDNL